MAKVLVGKIQCVITSDVIGSRKLSRPRLIALVDDLVNVIKGATPLVPNTVSELAYIPTNNPVNFLGDSFQFACNPLRGLDNMLRLRWYCKSHHLRYGDDTPGVDLRMGMGLSLKEEPENIPYDLAYLSSQTLQGKRINYNVHVVDWGNDQIARDAMEEIFTMLNLLDVIMTDLTPIQSRNLLYAWEYKGGSKAAEALGVAASTVSRSIQLMQRAILIASQRYRRLVAKSIGGTGFEI